MQVRASEIPGGRFLGRIPRRSTPLNVLDPSPKIYPADKDKKIVDTSMPRKMLRHLSLGMPREILEINKTDIGTFSCSVKISGPNEHHSKTFWPYS
jgi:hypothetical protein